MYREMALSPSVSASQCSCVRENPLRFKCENRLRGRSMVPDDFFHPYHIIPSSEFEPALMKCTDECISKMLMKIDAVSRQIFILDHRRSNTCIHIQNMLQKTGYKNRLDLAINARLLGIVVNDPELAKASSGAKDTME